MPVPELLLRADSTSVATAARRPWRRPLRGPLLAAGFVATAVLAGCGATPTSTNGVITGSTLAVYTRQPPGDPVAQDVVDAERLALRQAGGQVGRFRVALKVVSGAGTVTDAARTAIQDTSTIAYLGELSPHASADSLGITSGVGILQISPTDTALELTEATPAVAGSPDRYHQALSTYGRTFARVVPAADREAIAQARLMTAAGVHRLYLADDGTPYGRAVTLAVATAARRAGIAATEAPHGQGSAGAARAFRADAVFAGMAAGGGAAAARLLDAVATTQPRVKLYAPSALASNAFAGALGREAAGALTVTAPAVPDPGAGLAARTFAADFAASFHRRPGPEAVFGYAAMSLVLQSLRRAGASAVSRSQVVADALHTTNFPSVLGTITIDPATGDLKGAASFTARHVHGGRLVGDAAVQGR